MSETTIPAAEITGCLPIGSIVAYYGEIDNNVPSTVPDGWLLCNNASIPDGKEYNTLREFCKYAGHPGKVPDLRGMFLRGSSAGRTDEYADPEFSGRSGLGTIQKIGSYQHDEIIKHKHESYSVQLAAGGFSAWSGAQWPTNNDNREHPNYSFGGSETRPKNVYVNYIIKAK